MITAETQEEAQLMLVGTSLQGYVEATRNQIEKAFGSPIDCLDEDKVTTQWAFILDGCVCSIYDYKEEAAPEAEQVYRWHIGGLHSKMVNKIVALVEGK